VQREARTAVQARRVRTNLHADHFWHASVRGYAVVEARELSCAADNKRIDNILSAQSEVMRRRLVNKLCKRIEQWKKTRRQNVDN